MLVLRLNYAFFQSESPVRIETLAFVEHDTSTVNLIKVNQRASDKDMNFNQDVLLINYCKNGLSCWKGSCSLSTKWLEYSRNTGNHFFRDILVKCKSGSSSRVTNLSIGIAIAFYSVKASPHSHTPVIVAFSAGTGYNYVIVICGKCKTSGCACKTPGVESMVVWGRSSPKEEFREATAFNFMIRTKACHATS